MVEGDIYYCKLCEKYTRYDKDCPACGSPAQKLGWMKSND